MPRVGQKLKRLKVYFSYFYEFFCSKMDGLCGTYKLVIAFLIKREVQLYFSVPFSLKQTNFVSRSKMGIAISVSRHF